MEPIKRTINLKNIKKSLMNRENTLVSVILPTFNRGEKCVNVISDVLNQTYKNIELILINDGSDDKNSLIIENFLNVISDTKRERINYIKQSNKGLAASLNVGLDTVKGEYVTWISDDNKICAEFIQILLFPRSDFTYSNYNMVYDDNSKNYLLYNKH